MAVSAVHWTVLSMVAGVRCVQVRGYMFSLRSRYGSAIRLWVRVPVSHTNPHQPGYSIWGCEGFTERGLGMGSVFPGAAPPEDCRSVLRFGWDRDVMAGVRYYVASHVIALGRGVWIGCGVLSGICWVQ